MAEQANRELRGVKDSWSFMAFCRQHGLPRPNTSRDKEGNEFRNLVCTDQDNKYTFVNFSRDLGYLSNDEILARKHSLQVIKLNDDPETGKEGSFILCKAGNLNLGEVIDIFADEA